MTFLPRVMYVMYFMFSTVGGDGGVVFLFRLDLPSITCYVHRVSDWTVLVTLIVLDSTGFGSQELSQGIRLSFSFSCSFLSFSSFLSS